MNNQSFVLDPGFQFSAALDPHRRAAYQRALKQAFSDFDGAPSVALLGWEAATLIDLVAPGAGQIVIVEEDAERAENVHAAIVARGLGNNVSMVQQPLGSVKLDALVDIVVAGQASTWFIDGPGASVLANARANVLKPGGTMIPRRFVHLFELACSPTEINGISLRAPRYAPTTETIPTLSESKHWATTDGLSGFSVGVDDTIIVYPLLSGNLTGLRLTTLAEYSDNNIHSAAPAGFQTLVAPLRESLNVDAGQPVELFVKYTMGSGLAASHFSARLLQNAGGDTWEHADHPTVEAFRAKIAKMVVILDDQGRGGDLDKVVSYTVDPHGDVSRLAALFWTIDDEFIQPLRDLVDGFRAEASQLGSAPSDEVIYELMLETYKKARGI